MNEPLEEWIEKNRKELAVDIYCHLTVYVEDLYDRSDLYRCIMASIREYDNEYK